MSLPYKMVVVNTNDADETASQSLAGFSDYKDVYVIISSDAGPINYKFGLLKV